MSSARRTSVTNQSDERSTLAHDAEFLRFLGERLADEQREADRLQSEIDGLMAQVDSKHREQSERLNIVDACRAGIELTGNANRHAPQITTRDATPPVPVTTAEAAIILAKDNK